MAEYTVNLTDPLSPSISIPPKGVNGPGTPTADTTLKLYGDGYVNWGEAVNENFVRLLENFMGATPPDNPTTGQLWAEVQLFYRDTNEVLDFYRYDINPASGTYHTWVPIAVTESVSAPVGVIGNYWVETGTGDLYYFGSAYDGEPASWMPRATATGIGAPTGTPTTQVKVYDGAALSWVPVGAVLVSSSTGAPSDSRPGTLRFNDTTNTLYVWDGLAWQAVVLSGAASFSRDVDMNNNSIVNLADAVNPTDALNLQTGDARYVNVAGDTMTGDLNLSGNKINFTNMFLNEGDGNIAVAPDVRFTASGLVTAADNLLFIIDDDNSGVGNFVVAKGAQNSLSDVSLLTIFNDGEVRSNVTSYETLVVNDNSIPNKKFVDDRINAIPGKQTISIPASALRPRATNPCAFLATTTGAAGQPDIDFLAFDGDAAEYAKIAIAMPKGWNEGPITASFQWKRASGTSVVNVVWGVRAVALSDGDAIATSFTSATVVDDAKLTNTVVSISSETTPLTIGGSPQEGDLVMFEFYRDPLNASDTMFGEDAHLISVRLHYTTNATNDA